MCFVKNKKNEAFTLIEVMVAMAIIAVLASIAISNFSSYESKAHQGEAKIGLSAAFSLEKSFHGEYAAYIEDFTAIGYLPEGFKRYYSIGWSSPTVPNVVTNYTGGIGTYYYDYVNIPSTWSLDDAGTVQCDIATARSGLMPAQTTVGANPQLYDLRARGVIRKGQPCDEWAIDQDKTLRNTQVHL